MNTTSQKPALEYLISGYLDHDAYLLEKLALWCKKASPASQLAMEFKQQLHVAINHPGVVTAKIYEKWTGEDMESQNDVQERLREIWDACFPEERIH